MATDGAAPVETGIAGPGVAAAQGARERPRAKLPPIKRFKAPDIAKEQAAGQPTHDQMTIWVQLLNAQREIDNGGWKAMEDMMANLKAPR